VSIYRDWLAAHLPQLAGFMIRSIAKYLGFHSGPVADDQDFCEPLRKFRARTHLVASSTLALAQAASSFNARAVPVLSYVAQLSPPPPRTAATETWAANKVLRMPGNTVSGKAAYALQQLGFPRLRSPAVTCLASLIRAATSGKLLWADAMFELHQVAEQTLSLRRVFVDRCPWPGFWARPTFARFLQAAAAGDGTSTPGRRLATVCRMAATTACAHARDRGSVGLQAAVTRTLYHGAYDWQGLHDSVSARWAYIVGCPRAFVNVVEEDVALATRSCHARFRLDAFRTLMNGTPTAHRLHSTVRRTCCVFGCRGHRDSMTHYLSCPALVPIFDAFFATSDGPLFALERFGVVPVCWRRLAFFSILFRTIANLLDLPDQGFIVDLATTIVIELG